MLKQRSSIAPSPSYNLFTNFSVDKTQKQFAFISDSNVFLDAFTKTQASIPLFDSPQKPIKAEFIQINASTSLLMASCVDYFSFFNAAGQSLYSSSLSNIITVSSQHALAHLTSLLMTTCVYLDPFLYCGTSTGHLLIFKLPVQDIEKVHFLESVKLSMDSAVWSLCPISPTKMAVAFDNGSIAVIEFSNSDSFTYRVLSELKHDYPVSILSKWTDSRLIACRVHGVLEIYRVDPLAEQSLLLQCTINAHTAPISGIHVDSDQNTFYTVSEDEIGVWNWTNDSLVLKPIEKTILKHPGYSFCGISGSIENQVLVLAVGEPYLFQLVFDENK